MQQLFLYAVTIFFTVSLILFYFFKFKPDNDAKNAIKQKEIEDREAKREADIIIGEYPTYSRHCTDVSFQDTPMMEETV